MSVFVYLFRSTLEGQREAMGTPERAQRSMEAMMAWMRDLEAKGHLAEPGQPLDTAGKVVRGRKGESALVTDGPYAETKDVILGYILVRAKDLAEAAALAESCPMVIGGELVEVRPVLTGTM
ncbi:PhnB protein [Labilithrix luteola]|uniref:PhnB protein n=1 Tax=Labilithrix luteola TaxID=1391654 RepID=A0A0K1QGC4_9BACT|nr:YciI family protein [Labilithrix luteola]AKV04490.1 PhnB protein [Labilithrix luteola]